MMDEFHLPASEQLTVSRRRLLPNAGNGVFTAPPTERLNVSAGGKANTSCFAEVTLRQTSIVQKSRTETVTSVTSLCIKVEACSDALQR